MHGTKNLMHSCVSEMLLVQHTAAAIGSQLTSGGPGCLLNLYKSSGEMFEKRR